MTCYQPGRSKTLFFDLNPKGAKSVYPGPTHLGPAWAYPLGPGLDPPAWAQLGPTHLGPAWAHPLGPSLGPPTWISRRRRRRRRRRTNSQIQIQAPPNAPRDEILPQGKPSLLMTRGVTSQMPAMLIFKDGPIGDGSRLSAKVPMQSIL